MKNDSLTIPPPEKIDLHLSPFEKIDSKKYTLYEVLVDPFYLQMTAIADLLALLFTSTALAQAPTCCNVLTVGTRVEDNKKDIACSYKFEFVWNKWVTNCARG